ncbi:MAG: hypothetical protein LBN27_03570 [Prevotellaceae bacterium]|nr:hypothetical protein [Prevotellaceae bacterium]
MEQKEYMKLYRKFNRERINAVKRAYYEVHRAKMLIQNREYGAKRRLRRKAVMTEEERQKELEIKRACRKAYYEANKSKIKVRNREYYEKTHPAAKKRNLRAKEPDINWAAIPKKIAIPNKNLEELRVMLLQTSCFAPEFDIIVKQIKLLEIKEFHRRKNHLGSEPDIKTLSINNYLNSI